MATSFQSTEGVQAVAAPMLSKIHRTALQKWQTSYADYARRVRVLAGQGASYRVLPQRLCVDTETMLSLLEEGAFDEYAPPGVKPRAPSELTDTTFMRWLDASMETELEDIDDRVKAALTKVSWRKSTDDAKGSATQFFVDIRTHMRAQHVTHVWQNEQAKTLIVYLQEKLPPGIRQIIENRRKHKSEEKWKFSWFEAQVKEIAPHHAIFSTMLGKRKRDYVQKEDDVKAEDRGRVDRKQKAEKAPKKNGNTCWNPKCNGSHVLKDCPITDKKEYKRILDQKRSERKERVAKKASGEAAKKSDESDIQLKRVSFSGSDGKRSAYNEEGRYVAVLAGKVKILLAADPGSDRNALGQSTYEELKKTGVELHENVLKRPVYLRGAFAGSRHAARKTIAVDTQLQFQFGPELIRQVEYLVCDADMPETLLGRNLFGRWDLCFAREFERAVMAARDDEPSPDAEIKLASMATFPYSGGIKYNTIYDDPIQPAQSLLDDGNIGSDTVEEIDAALEDMLNRAAEKVSPDGLCTLRNLLAKHRNVFRIKMGADPPAKIEPLTIRLQKDARPTRATQRRYAAPQAAFITTTVKKLEKIGLIYRNPQSRWASPVLAVRKPGPESFRFTVDLRGPNAQTDAIVSAMPNMQTQLLSTAGSKCYFSADLSNAYWQCPLADESQEAMSMQTPLGVYSPRRVLQGGTDAGNHFQAATQICFESLQPWLLQWIDDFLIHATCESELLEKVAQFLEACNKYQLKLHAKKTDLFLNEAKWCGRIINEAGIRYDPRRLEALRNMKTPEFAADLQQFLCAVNWMREAIPEYTKLISPLKKILDIVCQEKGSRKKRVLAKVSLAKLWTDEHTAVYESIKERLQQQVTQAHPKSGYTMCLYTDASDTHWASVLTQVPNEDMQRPIEEQRHEPLSFLSGSFTGAAQGWSVPEKEAFALVESMTKLDYLVASGTTHIFTDHANLAYIFDPLGRNPGMARHTASKLLRWALRLSEYRYVIEHLAGSRNIWADLLTRWAVRFRDSVETVRLQRVLLEAPITPASDTSFDWPDKQAVQNAQSHSTDKPSPRFSMQDSLWQDSDGVVWIPADAHLLQLRILIAGHCGIAGHRGIQSTTSAITSYCWWANIKDQIAGFVRGCFHCLSTASGTRVPRPLGEAIHADCPNKVIHFDYLYIGQGNAQKVYCLIIKDDFSSYVWLTPTEAADAMATVTILIRWFAAFGVVLQWVSDRGSHFKNELVRELRQQTHGSHHFTLAYTPWANGTVEVVCREVLRTLRALLSEFQLPFRIWPSVLPIVQSVLNNTPLARLGNIAPITAMTLLPADNPLRSISVDHDGKPMVLTLTEIQLAQCCRLDKLRAAVEGIHRRVSAQTSVARRARVASHNARTGVRSANFTVGDYVLWGVLARDRGRKIDVRWCGPRRIVECLSNYIFVTEDLLTGVRQDMHGTRLKFFRNRDFEQTEELHDQLLYQANELSVVSGFNGIRRRAGIYEVHTLWRGFEEAEATWEPVMIMREDVPGLLNDYLQVVRREGTAAERAVAAAC